MARMTWMNGLRPVSDEPTQMAYANALATVAKCDTLIAYLEPGN